MGQVHSLTSGHRTLLAALVLALLSLGCGRTWIPDGPPCDFDPAELPAGWRRFELPFGVFYGPSYLGEATEVATLEGPRYEFSAPGMRVIAYRTSSIATGEGLVCSETQEAHQRVVWHRFESNRANAFGHQYQAYLWRRPLSRASVFSLWTQAEDERLSGDAKRIAQSVSPRQPGSR